MKKLLLAIIGVLIAGSFVFLAVRQAVHTKRNQKIQNIQIKLKDIQIDQANTNLDQLKLQLRDIKTGKLIDQSKIDELNKKIEEQQRIIEQAESDKQARAKQKADEAAKVAQAQATALGTTKAYAASGGSVESIIRQAAAKYGVSGDMLVRIARCESGLNPGSVAANFIAGTHPTGLFQHVAAYWPQRAINYGYPGANIFDATAQANVTAQMFRDGLQGLWECK